MNENRLTRPEVIAVGVMAFWAFTSIAANTKTILSKPAPVQTVNNVRVENRTENHTSTENKCYLWCAAGGDQGAQQR